MSGIRLNLIGLWLADDDGDRFYVAVNSVRTKVSAFCFSTFLRVWQVATSDYKVRIRLPSLTVKDDLLHVAWSFEDEDMSFLLSIDSAGMIDWFCRNNETGMYCGTEDDLVSVVEVPLDMVTRFFAIDKPAEVQ